MTQLKEVKLATKAFRDILMTKPHVVGVGTGYKSQHGESTNELSIVTLVRQKVPASVLSTETAIPKSLGGIQTDVIEVGELWAQQELRSRWRPAAPGVSISHFQVAAGTLGCVVRDREYGTRLILSNCHVLTGSSQGQLGDPILQPGPTDGGKVGSDILAYLVRFQPVYFNSAPKCDSKMAKGFTGLGNLLSRLFGGKYQFSVAKINPQAINLIDAALARPANDAAIQDEIQGIGRITGTAPAQLGMAVRKFGRTTGLTTGTVTVIDASVTINYFNGAKARFDNQILTTPMSKGGDSGSLLVDGTSPKAVGLLFAGSDRATLHNPIHTVLDLLKVNL